MNKAYKYLLIISYNMDIINKYFDNNYIISESKKFFFINLSDNKECCLSFKINHDDKSINCVKIKSNNLINGNEIIKKLENIAKELDIKYIKIRDVSFIIYNNVKLKLSIIKILMSGMSWYNKLGYFSNDHKSEIINNTNIINMYL